MIDRLWYSSRLHSCEFFRAGPDEAGGRRLRGDVVVLLGDRPAHVQYQVDVDTDWCTRRVDVDIEQATTRTCLRIAGDGQGAWRVDDVPAPDLAGCLDIDLGCTPSTNTLPIRRLGLPVGEQRDISVAWLRFPELTLHAATQSYRRLDDHTWRYQSGRFSATLLVDDDGYVRRYGHNLWRTPT
ncbi:MAG TPA: putative glycolipid-binding domain-containing protein [Acidimicrobiales bacterium]|jgi:hypothetical protein